MVRTDFKIRYQGSVLGYAWSLLRPLLMFSILYVVFANFIKIGKGIPHYPIFLLLGIVIWNFFNEMTVQSMTSIVGRGDLIRKIRIPRWIIVFSSSVSAVISLGLNSLVIIAAMILNHVPFMTTWVFVPLIMLEVYIFSLGLSLFLSAAYVKYRDVNYIWEVILQAGFYLTPIIYPLSLITNIKFQKLIMLNPMAQAIQDARWSMISHSNITTWSLFENIIYALIPIIIVVLTLIIGLAYFRSESKYFAENL